jgi:hypothetical protein
MGLEALKSAERAAGFAMASADDPSVESRVETVARETAEWRAAEPVLVQQTAPGDKPAPVSVTEWVKGLFGSGRRAPA